MFLKKYLHWMKISYYYRYTEKYTDPDSTNGDHILCVILCFIPLLGGYYGWMLLILLITSDASGYILPELILDGLGYLVPIAIIFGIIKCCSNKACQTYANQSLQEEWITKHGTLQGYSLKEKQAMAWRYVFKFCFYPLIPWVLMLPLTKLTGYLFGS